MRCVVSHQCCIRLDCRFGCGAGRRLSRGRRRLGALGRVWWCGVLMLGTSRSGGKELKNKGTDREHAHVDPTTFIASDRHDFPSRRLGARRLRRAHHRAPTRSRAQVARKRLTNTELWRGLGLRRRRIWCKNPRERRVQRSGLDFIFPRVSKRTRDTEHDRKRRARRKKAASGLRRHVARRDVVRGLFRRCVAVMFMRPRRVCWRRRCGCLCGDCTCNLCPREVQLQGAHDQH